MKLGHSVISSRKGLYNWFLKFNLSFDGCALVNSTKYAKTFPLRRGFAHGEVDEFINKFSRLVGLWQMWLVPNIFNDQVLLVINWLLKDTLPNSVKVSHHQWEGSPLRVGSSNERIGESYWLSGIKHIPCDLNNLVWLRPPTYGIKMRSKGSMMVVPLSWLKFALNFDWNLTLESWATL